MNDYYVYVYIDPRNHEEFYYGKGKGKRKEAHLDDQSDSEKAKRIRDIHKEGLSPMVRVIARGLSEEQALLVEKTLLWKLGKGILNIATGHFADNFRPHNTLHKELSGFDYRKGFYYYNVGDGTHRKWEDYVKFGFISGGQEKPYRDYMLSFEEGDAFAAYLKGKGFVGVGKILKSAERVKDVVIEGRRLLELPLHCRMMGDNCDDPERSEYVCRVEWLKWVPREQAKWRPKSKLYTTTHVRASLDGQPETIKYIEQEFKVSIRDVIA